MRNCAELFSSLDHLEHLAMHDFKLINSKHVLIERKRCHLLFDVCKHCKYLYHDQLNGVVFLYNTKVDCEFELNVKMNRMHYRMLVKLRATE